MPRSRPSLCITCGLGAGPSNSLNRLEDGRVCPTCSERLLDLLPPPFPGYTHGSDPRWSKREAADEVRGAEHPRAHAEKKARRRKRGSK